MIARVTVVLPTPLAGPAMMKALPGFCAGWTTGSLAILLSPMIKKDQVIQRNSGEPSGNFQLRPRKKLSHISQTKVGNWNYLLGNLQHPPELSGFEDAHPSDADAFATSRQPQILNGATGAVDIGLPNGVSSQDVRSIAGGIAGNAEIDGRVENAFELKLGIELAFLSFENFGGGRVGLLE